MTLLRSPSREQVVLALLLFGALVFIFLVVPIGIAEPRGTLAPTMSPRFLPKVLGVAIGALALIGLVAEHRRATSGGVGHPAPKLEFPAEFRVWGAFAILLASIAAISFVGMVPAAVLGFAGLLVLGGERRWWVYVVAGVAFPYALGWFFDHALHVPLPAGSLFR